MEANAKATRGGMEQLYTMTEKELREKLALESLGNNPQSSDQTYPQNRRWHDKQMPVRSQSQPKVPSRWTLKGPRCDRLTDRRLRLTVQLRIEHTYLYHSYDSSFYNNLDESARSGIQMLVEPL